MDERAALLDYAVIRSMQPALGRRLAAVTYSALEHEIGEARNLAQPVVCIGGELILHFEGVETPVVVTWAENAGWPDHFSIQVRRDSAFKMGALVDWQAKELPPWRVHIGSPLIGVRLFAQNQTPHVLELAFPDGRILLGDGYEGTFGDGDDLIIRPGDDPSLLNGWALMWSSS